MISEKERRYATMVLDVIDNVECPMLMFEGEKAIVRKALKAYIENNDTADTPQTDVPRCSVNGTPYDECGFCEHFNCDTNQCEADTPQTEDYDFRDEQEYNDRWDCPWE